MIINKLQIIVIIAFYSTLHTYAFPEEPISVSIGDVQIAIPKPAGFEPVTEEMAPFSEILTLFVSPTNERLALFVSGSDAVIAKKGEYPDVFRRFDIQTPRNLADSTISPNQFAIMKRIVIKQNENIFRRLEEQGKKELLQKIPEALAALSANDTLEDNTLNIAFSEFGIFPLPSHQESEQIVAHSIIHSSQISDGDEVIASVAGVATLTLLYLEEKVLFLYVHGEPSSLEWTREESQKWVEEIISINSKP